MVLSKAFGSLTWVVVIFFPMFIVDWLPELVARQRVDPVSIDKVDHIEGSYGLLALYGEDLVLVLEIHIEEEEVDMFDDKCSYISILSRSCSHWALVALLKVVLELRIFIWDGWNISFTKTFICFRESYISPQSHDFLNKATLNQFRHKIDTFKQYYNNLESLDTMIQHYILLLAPPSEDIE